jgi:NAD(P)-dependent dehydrogenase (short-subunit alcohol dehydrogenase family)
MGRLQGKVALITGGTSGIGAATARIFVQEGARVIITGRNSERGQQLAAELGARVGYVHGDVSREADVKAAVEETVRRFGRLDCLFNNAGAGGPSGRIEDVSGVAFDECFGVLVNGVFFGIKYAAPIMKQQGGGSIISNASVAGLRAGLSGHVYSAAKAAVIHLTCSVAMELGESGIRVNCICPGGIATPIFGKAFGLGTDRADETIPVMKRLLETVQPIQRAGLPEDIAQAALWLASDESTFVNGHALVVDGGLIGGRLWSEFQQRSATRREAFGLSVKFAREGTSQP